MRVLFVDDELEFLEIITKRLTHRGVEVHTASSGEAAIELAAQHRPEVIVLDVKMPGMNGLEALRKLRDITPATPVILLTGHASVGSAMEGMELGAFDYLLKPVSINELIIKLNEAIRTGSTT